MGDSFRSNAWDSQLDNMLDDLQQVQITVAGSDIEICSSCLPLSKVTISNPIQSVTSGGDISGNHGRITNGNHGLHSHAVSHTNGHQSHEYQVQTWRG